jgi:hypothetical protein
MQGEQISMFSAKDLAGSYGTARTPYLEFNPDALINWKQRVLTFQSGIKVATPNRQESLFGGPDLLTADSLNPRQLPRQNTQFWRWKAEDAGVAALYFVFDYAMAELPLLLYVGETGKSNQRWKGEHGCKHYLINYQQAHYHYDLPTQLGIAFWQDAPVQTRVRQQLERDLILKWRSPFNKENWAFWGTPFTSKA